MRVLIHPRTSAKRIHNRRIGASIAGATSVASANSAAMAKNVIANGPTPRRQTRIAATIANAIAIVTPNVTSCLRSVGLELTLCSARLRLLFLQQQRIAEDEDVDVGVHEAAVGVVRCTDDRLSAHVE